MKLDEPDGFSHLYSKSDPDDGICRALCGLTFRIRITHGELLENDNEMLERHPICIICASLAPASTSVLRD